MTLQRFRTFIATITEQSLQEGGNMFKDAGGQALTTRVRRQDIAPTIAWLETVTGLDLHGPASPVDGAPSYWLGSTGRKSDSGDLDLMVDERRTRPETLIQTLAQWVSENAPDVHPETFVRKSGNNVHFRAPIKGQPENGYVQVDFMFVTAPEWSQFILQAPVTSAYKGAHRAQMLFSLAKAAGYKVNLAKGMIDRQTGQVVTDPDIVAKIVLNDQATGKDLASVESMIAALADDPNRDTKLASYRTFAQKVGGGIRI